MFKNNVCSICGKEVKDRYNGNYGQEEWLIECKNGCMAEEFAYGSYRYHIFEKEFQGSYAFTDEQWKELHDKMNKEIQYWKENDRYIMKILSR